MGKVGESFCWLTQDDPSVCSKIGEDEQYLLSDLRSRNREKCIGCDELRRDLIELKGTHGAIFDAMLVILDEALDREHKLMSTVYHLEIRNEMRDILLHLSQSLKLALDPHEVVYKGLVAFTAGSSFGFNRGVALLAENGRLRGYFALGPKDGEEAAHVWREMSEKGITISDLLRFSPDLFEKEKAKFNSVLKDMEFDLFESPFKAAFEAASAESPQSTTVLEIPADHLVPSVLRRFYQQTTFWVVPLLSHLKKPLGALLLDNFLTHRIVSQDEKVLMEIFATEIAFALERGLTYRELQEKIEMLEEANRQIREHRQTILKLKEEAFVGEIVLQLTHTIKNPIVAIGGLARHLKKRLGESSLFGKYANAIVQEASRLEETLRDFVKFVDLKYPAERGAVSVNEVIEILVREKAEALGTPSPILWHTNLNPTPPILANERQLFNCLENIVNNSIEAMSDGGEIFVESSFDGQYITITIRDTGPGISEDAMKNLFTPFFTTKPTGSGLGLYTSKQIIESLRGEMTLLYEREKGCEVVIKLPAKEEDPHGENSSG